MGGLLLGVASCSDDPNVVPVDTRTGFLSTKGMRPLRVELYDYDLEHPQKFRVKSQTPLAFAFPAAYYADGLSLKGGPLAFISLMIDRNGWRPFSLVALPYGARPSPGHGADLERRKLKILVYSNYLLRPVPVYGPPTGGPPIPINGKWLGMNVVGFSYTLSRPAKLPRRPVIDGIDLDTTAFVAFDEQAADGRVQTIICEPSSYCNVRFLYSGRAVKIIATDPQLKDIFTIVNHTTQFLNTYRVD